MVGRRGHRADAIIAGRQAAGDSRGDGSLTIAGVVDALEEDELGGVEGGGELERTADVLNGHVGVADDVAVVGLNVLGRRVVGAGGVGEYSQVEVGDGQRDVEGRVRLEVVVELGVEDDCRDHVGRGGDLSHDWFVRNVGRKEKIQKESGLQPTNAVARARLDLQTVGNGLARAKVDEVGSIAEMLE